MHEYDVVDVTSDHPELTPALISGTRGVIVDLPENSTVAAVEFAFTDDIDVFLLDLGELRLINPTNHQDHETSRD